MLALIVSAALSLSSSPPSAVPLSVQRALEARFAADGKDASVFVSAKDAKDKGCVVTAVDVDDDAVVAAKANNGGKVAGKGRGKSARGRACVAAVVVDVRYRANDVVKAGSVIAVRVVAGDLEVEASGVVVPCAVVDRDAGFVCARVGSAVLRGVVDGGALLVNP